MHFDSIPARIGDHDGGHTLGNGVNVSRHMNAEQSLAVDDGVVLIDSFLCSTISNKVLGAGCDAPPGYRNSLVLRLRR